MPELPEVESVRKGLESLVKGQKIADVKVDWQNIIVTDDIAEWCQSLKGQQIEKIGRRAKFLIFYLTDFAMISHLRMEGKYHYFKVDEIPAIKDKHTHVRFIFTDSSQLHYHDVRKFGRMEIIAKSAVANYFAQRQIGPEPVAEQFDLSTFKKQLLRYKKAIKTILLEQKVVAGIGNIYADEILFSAQIHPTRFANRLSELEVIALHQAIIKIMQLAVQAGGSSIRTYLNALGEAGTYQNYLQVYGRKEEPCLRCGHLISKIQLGGRGTHFCSYCQQERLND